MVAGVPDGDFLALSRSPTGPTLIASVGTSEMLPPPLVRAFWATVSGWSRTTRVQSLRYSAGGGGVVLVRAFALGAGR